MRLLTENSISISASLAVHALLSVCLIVVGRSFYQNSPHAREFVIVSSFKTQKAVTDKPEPKKPDVKQPAPEPKQITKKIEPSKPVPFKPVPVNRTPQASPPQRQAPAKTEPYIAPAPAVVTSGSTSEQSSVQVASGSKGGRNVQALFDFNSIQKPRKKAVRTQTTGTNFDGRYASGAAAQPEQKPKPAQPVQKTDINALVREYGQTVAALIERHKKYPAEAKQSGTTGTARVRFNIASDGRLLDVRILESSNSDLLDDAATDAVRKASPYPPLPPALNRDSLPLSLKIVFKMEK